MKRYLKFAAGVGLALTVLAAGCGGGQQAAPAAKADAPKEIKIGANLELTGSVAAYGQTAYNGMKLAIKEINDKGGINGKKINLVAADNKSEVSEATNAATKLISQDKVVALVGPMISGCVVASAPVVTNAKVPLLTPSGTSEAVTFSDNKVREYVFRACFTDNQQGEIMAKFTLNGLKVKNVAILKDTSSDYAKQLAEVYRAYVEKNGGKIVAEESYLSKDTDFKPTLTKIKASNPEAIFVPGYYQEAGLIVKQARELGITAPLLGTDGWDPSKMVELAGAAALNNTYFCDHYSAEDKDPGTQKFITAYKAEYKNEMPNAFAALGYDTIIIMADALKRSGGEDSQKITAALASTKDVQAATSKFNFDNKHNPIKSAVILENKDGKQVFKDRVN